MSLTHEWYKTTIKNYGLDFIPFEEFKETKKIDRGGFGEIYSTTYTPTSEVVILKEIFIGDEENQTSIKNFLNELKLHSSLEHDHIIKFYGVSQDSESENNIYLMMEFANEGNLRNYLLKKKDNLMWEEKIRLAIQLAEGISYLHYEQNIAHLDLVT
ncbi:7898_t:CDS:2 [Acaulospora morrowiae]|uniref:non-specific serine/threonine protein kinase n=1 Tax=Acaulospora morrowiae TaxID=94023 RepID=A0A9N9HER9_9GLOM|nr:7898_t:CDS:2 [Acaulospora morrowiae]